MSTLAGAPGGAGLMVRAKDVAQPQEILQYLKDRGERLDAEIAADTGASLENVCLCLSELADNGAVMMCRTTRFTTGGKIEGMLCRVSRYFPLARPGRKSKAQKQAGQG